MRRLGSIGIFQKQMLPLRLSAAPSPPVGVKRLTKGNHTTSINIITKQPEGSVPPPKIRVSFWAIPKFHRVDAVVIPRDLYIPKRSGKIKKAAALVSWPKPCAVTTAGFFRNSNNM
jgi:hypothetical protein